MMRSTCLLLLALNLLWCIHAFGPTLHRQQSLGMSKTTTTQLGISEALGCYIDAEYYRQNHKDEYSAAWMYQNKAAILYHDHHGNVVMGDPHIDFNTPHHVHAQKTESAQHYVAAHPSVMCNLKDKIMELRPHEFMRECHGCNNRCSCQQANDYYNTFLAPLKPKEDTYAYAYLR